MTIRELSRLLFLIFAFNLSGHVYAIDCAVPPVQLTKDKQATVKTAVASLAKLKGPELEIAAQQKTNDLLGQLPNADTVYLQQMFFSAFCSGIRDDPTIPEGEKANRILQGEITIHQAFSKKADVAPAPPPQAKLLVDLLDVPIHSSLHDAKSSVPNLHVLRAEQGKYTIQYGQTFLGFPAKVIQNMNAETITEDAIVIIKDSTAQDRVGAGYWYQGDPSVSVYPLCFGDKYAQMIQHLIENFGLPKEYAPTQWDASNEISQDFKTSASNCDDGISTCSKTAMKKQQTRVFNDNDFGEVTFTATRTHAIKKLISDTPDKSGDRTEDTCEWILRFVPKH